MTTPRWYENAVLYQTHVRAFSDADGDGIGDFAGLTDKLGYVRDLGATAIWLLPFYASPLRDGGYDIADYRRIHPDYGTLDDFDRFVAKAHGMGLKVITELVVNHTSDQHPWFQRARRAPKGSPERDFYVWSDTGEEYPQVRIIFPDYEPSNWTWDPVAKAYFWHRFFHHQPDLNWGNREVEQAVHEVVDFWLERGVDGLRLDAIPYLCVREGTTCENLPETHAALKRLRAHIDAKHDDKMLLAEANQWPEDAVSFFGDGDECHMNFAFPVMPRLYLSLETQDASSIRDILEQIPELPEGCAWATFLRNHDELTLEMVTHEERRRMWAAYAEIPEAIVNLGLRRRLAPLLRGDRAAIELLNGVLFGTEGTPILYYGDEIGMGDDVFLPDRDGVRTPMQWTGDRNAGFSEASPQRLYLPVNRDPAYRYEAVNVEAQAGRQGSLLAFTRRLVRARRASPALSEGAQEVLPVEDPAVFATLRRHREQDVLVVASFARRTIAIELELSGFDGRRPVSLLDGGRLPTVEGGRLAITLPPLGFAYLELTKGHRAPPFTTRTRAGWPEALEGPEADRVARALLGPEAGPLAGTAAHPLDDGGLWWLVASPCHGPDEARLVRARSPVDAEVVLQTRDGDVGLADESASPDALQDLFDAFSAEGAGRHRLRGADPRPSEEGWVFTQGDLRAVLSRHPEPGPGRHREVQAVLREQAPELVAEPVASIDVAGCAVARLERLPPGELAEASLAAAEDPADLVAELALALARLHAAIAASDLEAHPLTPYDARALYQSLRTRIARGVAGWRQRGVSAEAQAAVQTIARAEAPAIEALAPLRGLDLSGARLTPHGRPGPSAAWRAAGGVVWLDLAGAPDLHPSERTVPRSPLEDLAALVTACLAVRAPDRARADHVADAALAAFRGGTDPALLPGTESVAALWPALLADAALRAARPSAPAAGRPERLAVAAWAARNLAEKA